MLTEPIGKPIVAVAEPPPPVLSPVAFAIETVGADVYPLPLELIAILLIDLPQ